MLPLKVYRAAPDGSKTEARDTPYWTLLHDAPNGRQTRFEYMQQQSALLALRGNCYAEKLPGRSGAVGALEPILPTHVTVDWLRDGQRRIVRPRQRVYEISADHDGQKRLLTQEQVHHVHLLSLDGLVGLSPVGLAREGISLAAAAEVHGARYFGAGARPGGVLSSERAMGEKEREANEKAWKMAHQGVYHSHQVAVLSGGLKWSQIGLSNEDSQFLESRKFQVADIARFWGVPLFLIQETEKSTSWGTGIEQMSLGFVTYTLGYWLANWEQSYNRHVIRTDRRPELFSEFLVDALLRGDIKTRFEAYSQAINANDPWMLVNEIRQKENMDPLPDGDERRVPMNTAPNVPPNGDTTQEDRDAPGA